VSVEQATDGLIGSMVKMMKMVLAAGLVIAASFAVAQEVDEPG